MGEIIGVKMREFEDKDPHLVADRLEEMEKAVVADRGIEEGVVGQACPAAISREIGECFDRDVIGHFEREAEAFRHLGSERRQIGRSGTAVIGGVHFDGGEGERVFGEAFPLEPGLGEPAPVEVTLLVIEQAAPVGKFPGRGAEVDLVVLGESPEGFPDKVALE